MSQRELKDGDHRIGRVTITNAADRMLNEAGQHFFPYFHLHLTGDFGEISEEEKAANLIAQPLGGRVVSRYAVNGPQGSFCLSIIDDADGSCLISLLEEVK